MKTIQTDYFASCGLDDSLNADLDTIKRYLGCSALSAIDAIDLAFTGRQLWRANRIGNDYTMIITGKALVSLIDSGL